MVARANSSVAMHSKKDMYRRLSRCCSANGACTRTIVVVNRQDLKATSWIKRRWRVSNRSKMRPQPQRHWQANRSQTTPGPSPSHPRSCSARTPEPEKRSGPDSEAPDVTEGPSDARREGGAAKSALCGQQEPVLREGCAQACRALTCHTCHTLLHSVCGVALSEGRKEGRKERKK